MFRCKNVIELETGDKVQCDHAVADPQAVCSCCELMTVTLADDFFVKFVMDRIDRRIIVLQPKGGPRSQLLN